MSECYQKPELEQEPYLKSEPYQIPLCRNYIGAGSSSELFLSNAVLKVEKKGEQNYENSFFYSLLLQFGAVQHNIPAEQHEITRRHHESKA